MDSARITFERKEQEIVAGRPTATWVKCYKTWADLPALSMSEQSYASGQSAAQVQNRTVTEYITLEVRVCAPVRAILSAMKDHRVIYEGRPYMLHKSDKSRKHEGWVRILASRSD